jgi:hypothetical protein
VASRAGIPPRLRAWAWAFAGITAALATIYGALRLKAELGYSPLHYVIEDALVLAAGILGIVAAVARVRRANADTAAAAAAVALAASLERLPPGVRCFEVRARPARLVAIALIALLLVAVGVGMGAMAWSPRASGALAWSLACLATAAGLSWFVLRQAPWARPALRLDAEGVTHWFRGSVRWADVIGLRLDWIVVPRGGRVPMLFLGLNPGVPVPANPRHLIAGPPGVWALNLRGLDQSPERIEAAALELRDGVLPPRLPGWHQALRPDTLAAMQESTALIARFEQLEASGAFGTEAGNAEFTLLTEQLAANSERLLANARDVQAKARQSSNAALALLGLVLLLGLAAMVLPHLG